MNLGCGAHIGDVLWCLMFLTRLPGAHTLYVNEEYLASIRELAADSNVAVNSVMAMPPGTEDGWIANGRFTHKGLFFANDIDIMGFVRKFMGYYAEEAGHPGILDKPESFLCKFPAILHTNAPSQPFDILAVNCNPKSGQCPHFRASEFDGLLIQLAAKGHRVLCTNPTHEAPWTNYSLAQIANLSLRARAIIAVASGPHWATWNVWNAETPRYIFLDPMRLDFGQTPTRHAANAEQMRGQLAEDGWL